MMEVYFDESGTHASSPVVCVAGYLFKTEQARHLNREWDDLLAQFGVTVFHATDCSNGVGQFKKLDPTQRIDLTKRVIGIVKRRMEVGFVVTLSETDFKQIDAPTWLKGGPYLMCAMHVILGVSAWADTNSFDGDIAYFFESGDRLQLPTSRAFDELFSSPIGKNGFRHSSHSFIPKLGNGPLQAADLLAYEWYREISRLNDPLNKRPSRRSFDALLDHPGYYQSHLGATDLDRFMKRDRDYMLEKMGSFHRLEERTI